MPTQPNETGDGRFRRVRRAQACVAGFLVLAIAVSFLGIPKPAAAVACGGGGPIGGPPSGLFVPVFDSANLVANAITAGQTTALDVKSVADCILTGLLKVVINFVRDLIIRWLVTGRFGMPAFSTSIQVDLARSAENASRIFLSQLSGINFCQGFNIPAPQNYNLDFSLTVACTLSSSFSANDTDSLLNLRSNPAAVSLEDRLALGDPQNNRIYAYIFTLDEKERQVARAAAARANEYNASQGFLGTRNADGSIKTPGSVLAKLIMEQVITSPSRQVDVADTVQQAITAIINTAFRVVMEKGLNAAFGSGQ